MNQEQLAWILPHFRCPDPDCSCIDILVDEKEMPKWLEFGLNYIDKEFGFECSICKKKFHSLGFLDTHLLKVECVDKDKINEYRVIHTNEMKEKKSTPDFMDKMYKIIHGKKLREEWTEEETLKLIALRSEGKTNIEIARDLCKKPTAIMARIVKLIDEGRLEKKHTPLTEEEVIKLIELRKQDKSNKEIAVALNKPTGAITAKISQLMREGKLETKRDQIDDDILISYVKGYYKEAGIRGISEAMGISQGAIYIKLGKIVGKDWKKILGLEDPEIQPAPKTKAKIPDFHPLKEKRKYTKHSNKMIRWTKQEEKFLLKSKLHMSEIAKKLKRSVGSCYVKRCELTR